MGRGVYPDDLGNTSPWDDDRVQDTKEYLTSWLGWHNASTDMGRW